MQKSPPIPCKQNTAMHKHAQTNVPHFLSWMKSSALRIFPEDRHRGCRKGLPGMRLAPCCQVDHRCSAVVCCMMLMCGRGVPKVPGKSYVNHRDHRDCWHGDSCCASCQCGQVLWVASFRTCCFGRTVQDCRRLLWLRHRLRLVRRDWHSNQLEDMCCCGSPS